MSSWSLIAAYAISLLGGWLGAGLVVWYLRKFVVKNERPFFRQLDLFVGGAERLIATTLTIWAPNVLPIFVGGWVAAKLAANWQRRTTLNNETEPEKHASAEAKLSQSTLSALVGSAVSFSIAIGAGVYVHRDSLCQWTQRPSVNSPMPPGEGQCRPAE